MFPSDTPGVLTRLERTFDRMRAAPNQMFAHLPGPDPESTVIDWRAVMDSIPDASNFRKPERWNSVPVPERVAQRILENIDKQPDGCWISKYSVASHGYSQIGWQTKGKRHVVLGHRAAWVAANGQVPLGMTLDHLCKQRRCVNPAHLRLLPNYENARRVAGEDWPIGYCKRGHPNSELREYPRMRGAAKECQVCRKARYIRNNWIARHPGEPIPAHIAAGTTSEQQTGNNDDR